VKEDLKTELRTDISTVTAGQEELKKEINARQEGLKNDISAVTDNISALETKINAGKKN
jgi:hypothetical protein